MGESKIRLGNLIMKTQIKFQKKLALITLIIAALAFVFAICFFSGNLSDVMSYRLSLYRASYSAKIDGVIYSANTADYLSPVNDWILAAQSTLNALITMTIIYFVVIAFIYITSTQSRRNYYITNYVMTGIVVVYSLALALFGLISMLVMMGNFMSLTFVYDDIGFQVLQSALKLPEISYAPTMFIIGIVAYVLVLLVALAWVYNLIWKNKLMKGEKELLSKGCVQEVA